MNAYISNTFSDEEGPMAEEGKTIYISGDKDKLLELCDFFSKVKSHLAENEMCHMHFRDNSDNWNKHTYIDVIVDLDKSMS